MTYNENLLINIKRTFINCNYLQTDFNFNGMFIHKKFSITVRNICLMKIKYFFCYYGGIFVLLHHIKKLLEIF